MVLVPYELWRSRWRWTMYVNSRIVYQWEMCTGLFENFLRGRKGVRCLGGRWSESLKRLGVDALFQRLDEVRRGLGTGSWCRRQDFQTARLGLPDVGLPSTCRWSLQCIFPGAHEGFTGLSVFFSWYLLSASLSCWKSAVVCQFGSLNSKTWFLLPYFEYNI